MRFRLEINNLASGPAGFHECLNKGMNIWLIVLAVQVVAVVIALVRESGEDKQFEGEKLGYRS